MAAIGRVLVVLLAAFAGIAFVGGGLVMIDGLQAGDVTGINYTAVGLILGGIPFALSLLWLWALQRTAFGPNRSARAALLAAALFVAAGGFIAFAFLTDMPLSF